MSSLTLPKWPAAPRFTDRAAFRSWLQGATNPTGSGFGLGRQREHWALAPLAVQAELSRGCNAMVLDALTAGPENLAERLHVVSGLISDCHEFAVAANRGLVGNLSGRRVTPVDAEDIFKLSRLFIGGIEKLESVVSTSALLSITEPALYPIHTAIGESLTITATALPYLGNRQRGHDSYVQLAERHRKAKVFARQYFNHLHAAADSPGRSFAVTATRQHYGQLLAHLGATADAFYRTTLKNG